jgi:ribosomal protein L37AE/L43A
MDLTSITTVLGSIKTATEIAKLIKDSDLSLEKAETKLKLAELISALADAKIEVTDIQHVLIEKDQQIRVLEERFSVKQKLKWVEPNYWVVDGEQKDGPYCQHCYDKNKELIRLQGNGEGYWECKACKNIYTDSNYQPFIGTVSRNDYDPYGGF